MGSCLLVVCLLKRRNQYTLAVYSFSFFINICASLLKCLRFNIIINPKELHSILFIKQHQLILTSKQKKWAAKRKKHTKELISMGSKNLVVSKMMKSRSSKFASICLTSKTKDFYQLTT